MTYEFKLEVEDGKREMTNELQDGIVEFNNKMISSRSMTVPEFSRLKPSNRVSIISLENKMLVKKNKSKSLE